MSDIVFAVKQDNGARVVATTQSNVLQEGFTAVDEALFRQIEPKVGRVRLVNGELQDISVFDPAPTPTIPVFMLRQRVEKLGLLDEFSSYLFQYPPLAWKLLSLESGADPADPAFSAAFSAMGIPKAYRDYILAPASVGVPAFVTQAEEPLG